MKRALVALALCGCGVVFDVTITYVGPRIERNAYDAPKSIERNPFDVQRSSSE